MGSILSSVRLRSAQSSGLSPSPTEESGHKVVLGQETHTDEEQKSSSITDEKPLEEPESNDTSYGVEATAVRTLAASTGTVAILGTTAKVKEINEPAVLDFTLTTTIPAINDAKETISEVLSHKDNTDSCSSEIKEAVIPDSVNTRFSEKEEKNVPAIREDLESPRDKNILEIREEEVADKVEKGKNNSIVQNSTDLRQADEVITITGNDDLSLVDVPHETDPGETKPDSMCALMRQEKEHVKIVDYQEKIDRAHEPKIVEEMSVKKEENLNKVSYSKGIGLKKENVSSQKSPMDLEEQKLTIEPSENKIGITTVEQHKTTPELEPVSPEASKTEEDDEISSEQLKTNSLSEMSLSENLNSDGEEAARAASKALELKEMVASLSSTTNILAVDDEASENINNPKDVSKDDIAVNSSLHVPEEHRLFKLETSRANEIPEETMKENVGKPFETTRLVSVHSSEKEPSTVSIPENSEDTISSSENSQEERESNVVKEDLENPADLSYSKVTKNDVQEKESEEQQYFVDTISKIQETVSQHQESENQEKITEIQQNLLIIDENEEKAEVGEVCLFKQMEDGLKHDEGRVAERIKLGKNEKVEQGEYLGEVCLQEESKDKDNNEADHKELEHQNVEKENNIVDKSIVQKNTEAVTAATTIQSGFRGYRVRKHFKESGSSQEVKQIFEQNNCEEIRQSWNETISRVPENLEEKEQTEDNISLLTNESKTSETEKEEMKRVPKTLMKIAKAEVDKICKDAEKATESLVLPLVNDDSEIETQDFPAPPDELLSFENQSEEIKGELSNSGTQSNEATMPLGSNHTEGDSSKTEETTAPSLAESEMLKSTSFQNEDFPLESSFTENINTEIAMQRDSTEGELTMEEDLPREDVVSAPIRSDIVCKMDGENSLTPEEEKAATVIQAGYRGFKTRKRLRDESSIRSNYGTDEELYINNESNYVKSSTEDEGDSKSSNSIPRDKSEQELNDSAKKIQAGVRGYLVRKKQKVERNAAVTIQSHFRGFKIRQLLKQQST